MCGGDTKIYCWWFHSFDPKTYRQNATGVEMENSTPFKDFSCKLWSCTIIKNVMVLNKFESIPVELLRSQLIRAAVSRIRSRKSGISPERLSKSFQLAEWHSYFSRYAASPKKVMCVISRGRGPVTTPPRPDPGYLSTTLSWFVVSPALVPELMVGNDR